MALTSQWIHFQRRIFAVNSLEVIKKHYFTTKILVFAFILLVLLIVQFQYVRIY